MESIGRNCSLGVILLVLTFGLLPGFQGGLAAPIQGLSVLVVGVWLGMIVYLRPVGTRRQLIPFFGSLLLFALYAVNARHHWVNGVGLVPRPSLAFLPGSSVSSATLQSMWILMLVVGLWGMSSFLARAQTHWFRIFIACAAFLVSVWVLSQRWMPKPFPVYPFTGPFVNENHYAAWANLLFPVLVIAGFRSRERAFQSSQLSSPAGLYWAASGLLALSILVSESRAGALLLGLNSVGVLFLLVRRGRTKPLMYSLPGFPAQWLVGGAALLLFVLSGLVVWRESGSFAVLREQLLFRSEILLGAMDILKHHPVWGTGPGTFSVVFPYYAPDTLEAVRVVHAHCDPLQMLTEYGVIGTCILLVALGLLLFRLSEPTLPSQAPDLMAASYALGLLTLALHCLIDFPFRIPAITATAAVWILLGCRYARSAGMVGAHNE